MNNAMHVITFTLTTCEPLLLSSLQGDPNSSVSFHYIPGSVIRGALIGRYLKTLSPARQTNLLEDPDSSRLFFSGETRFLNGYICQQVQPAGQSYVDQRSLPLSRSLRHEKRKKLADGGWDSSTRGYAAALQQPSSLQDGPEGAAPARGQHKAISELFGWIDASGSIREAPRIATVLNIHTARHRTAGRANAQSGAVFRYEALAAAQTFAAAILCQSAADASSINALLKPNLIWLGGSRSAGYGKTRIDTITTLAITPVNDQTPACWDEAGSIQPHAAPDHTLTLLSDLIIRDEFGQFSGDIRSLLGQYGLTLIPERSTMHTTLVGGFNRTWGLPLAQAQALGMGSTLVVKGDISRLKARINAGLGERRAEGFGRFAIDWQPTVDNQGKIIPASEQAPPHEEPASAAADDAAGNSTLLSTDDPTTRLVLTRILRQRFDHGLLALAQRYEIRGEISPTQLARLWLVARNSISATDFKDVTNLVEGLPANAKRQFRQATVGSASLYYWLITLNDTHAALEWPDTTLLTDDSSIIKNLTTEYTLRLVMTMAKYARKHQQHETVSASQPPALVASGKENV